MGIAIHLQSFQANSYTKLSDFVLDEQYIIILVVI